MNLNPFRVLLLLGLLLPACGGETEGRVVTIGLRVQPQAEPEHALGEFETDTGWQVKLSQATLGVSALYALAELGEPGVMARLERLLVPVARAHGGHDPAGGLRANAELLEPLALDLLDPEGQDLPEVSAQAGPIAKLVLEIAPPDADDLPEALHGYQAWVAGEATRGDERVRFEGGLTVPDEGVNRRIEVMARDVVLDEGGVLTLSIRPSRWLHDASFERLEPAASEDEPAAITPESQVGRAWFVGARSPSGLSVQWEPQGEEP